MAFSLAAKIHCGRYWLRKASLGLQRMNVYKTAAVGARVHRKLSRQSAGLNLLLSARTGTIMLSARAQALLVSYATLGRDDGLDGGCSLSSSRNRFLLRSEKRLDPLKSCPILQHIARRPACLKQRCTLVTGQLTRARGGTAFRSMAQTPTAAPAAPLPAACLRLAGCHGDLRPVQGGPTPSFVLQEVLDWLGVPKQNGCSMRRSAMTKGGVEVGGDIHIGGTHVLRLIAAHKSEAATEAICLLMSMQLAVPAQTVPVTPEVAEVPGTPSTSETAAPEAVVPEVPAQSLVDDDEPMQPAPPDEEDDVAPPPPPPDEEDDVAPPPPPPDEDDDVAPPEPLEDDDVAPAPVASPSMAQFQCSLCGKQKCLDAFKRSYQCFHMYCVACMRKGEQAKSGGRHWDQCPVCQKKRGLERYSGPYYFRVTLYEFPLPADVPEECKFLS